MINGTQDNCTSGAGTVTPHFQLLCPYNCYIPSLYSISQITSTSATVDNSCYLCTGNQILEYGLSGFIPGTDSFPGSGGTIFYGINGVNVLTGLLPATTYDLYLREYCDSTNAYSDNSIKYSFTTLPLCSTAPGSITSSATNNTICSGQSVTLTQVGGVLSANGAFHWYADSCGGTSLGTGYSKTFSPVATSTYYVRAEDTCGVTACASITITVNPSPAPPTITGDTTICAGTSTILTASGGYACYLWSMASTTQSVTVSNTGIYMVTVCDANGCTASASVAVTVYPIPVPVITGNTTICQGSSTTLNAGAGYACYLWSTGANTQTINVTFTGTYTVTVCDANGCTGSGSITVTVNPNPVAVITPSVTTYICLGDTVHFTANTGAGFIYQWYKNSLPISGAVNSFYDAFASGNYSFAVTDSNGCYGLSSFTHVQIICFPPLEPSELRMTTESNDDIVLIPNPASHEITIQTGRALQSIKIFDIVGQLVYSSLPTAHGSRFATKINISNFSKGIYFVEVNDGKEKMVRKFVKE